MNNIERYEAFNKKLREILTLYEEVYFRNDGTYNIDSRTYELFEENPSALFVVFAEFCPKNDEELGRVKIHYDIKYGGTNDFNNLLDKYNMENNQVYEDNMDYVDYNNMQMDYEGK